MPILRLVSNRAASAIDVFDLWVSWFQEMMDVLQSKLAAMDQQQLIFTVVMFGTLMLQFLRTAVCYLSLRELFPVDFPCCQEKKLMFGRREYDSFFLLYSPTWRCLLASTFTDSNKIPETIPKCQQDPHTRSTGFPSRRTPRKVRLEDRGTAQDPAVQTEVSSHHGYVRCVRCQELGPS
jgi:hypothetical protein